MGAQLAEAKTKKEEGGQQLSLKVKKTLLPDGQIFCQITENWPKLNFHWPAKIGDSKITKFCKKVAK
jgi:hypothetical protein